MKNKIVAIGDTHGRNFWKQIVQQETFDKIIFLGDYFDTRDGISAKDQMLNFQDIIALKESSPEDVILLIGNHDFHYMPIAMQIGERYSGFQSGASYAISHLLQTHKSLLQAAYLSDGYLFTHAGVTKTWLKRTMGLSENDRFSLAGIPIDEYINSVFNYSPRYFLFTGNDPYGDDSTQSPIWVRPQSLNEDAFNAIHVVGHTSQNRIGIEPTKFLHEGSGFFIDTLGSSKEYLVIEKGEARPVGLPNPERSVATDEK